MRVLMVSTEYPPMTGGIGRYTSNLTNALQKQGLEVYVACDYKGDGNFSGIYPENKQNSEVLLRIVEKLKPDLVHIQFDPGLYGLMLSTTMMSRKGRTHIDLFYYKCKTPIITTFHSVYTLKEWIKNTVLIKRVGRTGRLGVPARIAVRAWKRFLDYRSFQNLNREKLELSRSGIVFSHYMYKLLGGGEIIYHGADPALSDIPNKNEARAFFSLPQQLFGETSKTHRIVLALGFNTATKGWDMLQKMHIPDEWTMVVNSSKAYYNTENIEWSWNKTSNKNVIDIQRGYLSEEELSMLFYASDAVVLPYSVTSGSGVMFDAIAHGLPFVATDLEFFREFSSQNLGITVKRNADSFSKGLQELHRNYSKYAQAVNDFKGKLKWSDVAKDHLKIYKKAMQKTNHLQRDNISASF
jgi:glycosyltransferase involved in cell wall biosynthesis